MRFDLKNPLVSGTLETQFDGSDETDAAKQVWSTLSKNFALNLPVFAFSLERQSDNKLFHFKVEERIEDGNVNFSMEPVKGISKASDVKKFNSRADKFEKLRDQILKGGKKKKKKRKRDDDDDDDDDESSSTDSYGLRHSKYYTTYTPYTSPINYWWYSPHIYDISSVCLPTFNVPLSPYVYIDTYGNYWY